MGTYDDTDATALLDTALDGVLRARVAIGGLTDGPVPHEALDAALVGDAGAYRRAIRAHRRAYERLRPLMDPDHADLLITLADTGNALAAASAEVGWKLGVTARGATP